jgi:hypothetical protein
MKTWMASERPSVGLVETKHNRICPPVGEVNGGIRTSKALFRREEEYEMDLWVVKYASRRSRIGEMNRREGEIGMMLPKNWTPE